MRIIVLVLAMLAEASHGAVILQYHHVDTVTPPVTSTSPASFDEHLAYIEASELMVVPLADIVATPSSIDDRRVAITFDDAYDNLLKHAIPELKAKKWPFTIFVATEFVGQSGYLSWKQLQAIESMGGTLANHTHSHLHMLRLREAETNQEWLTRLTQEINDAEALLNQHLQHPAKHLAYPYGEYSAAILQLTDELGYAGFGQQSGAVGEHSDRRLLPRFPLSGAYANLESFKVKIHTQAMPAKTPFVSPLVGDDIPTLQLEFGDATLRLSALQCYGPKGRTDLTSVAPLAYTARSASDLPTGRSRYNCTMPIKNSEHFYWFSQLWIKKMPDGSWYPEP